MEMGGGHARMLSCPGGTCSTIDVTVNEPGGGKCELAMIPDLSVHDESNGEKRLSWMLPSNFEWSKEPWKSAIFIQKGADPAGKFGPITITEQGRKLQIIFNHVRDPSEIRGYKYALSARRAGSSGNPGAFCETLDPWLIS